MSFDTVLPSFVSSTPLQAVASEGVSKGLGVDGLSETTPQNPDAPDFAAILAATLAGEEQAKPSLAGAVDGAKEAVASPIAPSLNLEIAAPAVKPQAALDLKTEVPEITAAPEKDTALIENRGPLRVDAPIGPELLALDATPMATPVAVTPAAMVAANPQAQEALAQEALAQEEGVAPTPERPVRAEKPALKTPKASSLVENQVMAKTDALDDGDDQIATNEKPKALVADAPQKPVHEAIVPVVAAVLEATPKAIAPMPAVQAPAIKVDSAPIAPPTTNPYVMAQVSQDSMAALQVQIQKRVRENQTQFNIELYPAHLGRVDVKLDIDAQGLTRAHMVFEKSAVADACMQAKDQLRDLLMQSGLKVESQSITVAARETAPSATPNHAASFAPPSVEKPTPPQTVESSSQSSNSFSGGFSGQADTERHSQQADTQKEHRRFLASQQQADAETNARLEARLAEAGLLTPYTRPGLNLFI